MNTKVKKPRLNLELDATTHGMLTHLAASEGRSITEIIKRAVKVYDLLSIWKSNGIKVFYQKPDEPKPQEVEFL